jgi:hypothetical protein
MKKTIWTGWFLVSVVSLIWGSLNAMVMGVSVVYLMIWINFGIAALYGAGIKD